VEDSPDESGGSADSDSDVGNEDDYNESVEVTAVVLPLNRPISAASARSKRLSAGSGRLVPLDTEQESGFRHRSRRLSQATSKGGRKRR
jgi:hypothetical protein